MDKKNKVYLSIAAVIIGLMILVMFLPIIFMPRLSKEERAEIINTFADFENRDNIILRKGNCIFLSDKRIDVNDVKYKDGECYLIDCFEDGFYAYAFEEQGKNTSAHLLEISYDLTEIKYIDTINNVPRTGTASGFYLQNKLYKGIYKDNYYVYDLNSKTYTLMPKAYVDVLRSDAKKYSFDIIRSKGSKCGIEITDKKTEETKTVSMDSLNDFAEGRFILSIKPYFIRDFFAKAIEKDGDIYIIGMITLKDYQYECVVLKYDFNNDKLSYSSSMVYNWDGIPNDICIINE